MPGTVFRSRRLVALALPAMLAGLVALVLVTRPEKPIAMKPPPAARVETVVVERRDLHPVERLGGRLVPWRQARLAFEATGRVVTRAVEAGERHREGDLLLALDPREADAALREARARLELERAGIERDRRQLALARENVRLQEKEVRRLASLGDDALVSASRREAARIRLAQLRAEAASLASAVASAEARLALREAAVARARLALDRTRLRMPFDGVVDAVHFEVGDLARPGEVAVVVADDARLEVRLAARSAAAASLTPGQRVGVRWRGAEVEGRVASVAAVPDARSWTRELVVRLPAGFGEVGAWVDVTLPLPTLAKVLTVPVTALLRDESGVWVFRVEGERLARVRVRPGPRVGDRQVVEAGLREGERIVARDVAALGDGQKVEVVR